MNTTKEIQAYKRKLIVTTINLKKTLYNTGRKGKKKKENRQTGMSLLMSE